ncbi:hypothetical protein YK48G_04220 [Lentilactobacillus fungorum]|uniref:DUF1064 domain-containing protein n=1 Tax=Lentilactobacillus fungorum TaxID=2201250 RepID=A0ABQ3VVT6_9LACO|nr:DUF1064 domain-containing protein [Lentilactobacillus fungorum]GHP12997.1 hypothetical protein YK48G_04220 [Lentilactobacillus fungorum]
MTQSSKELSPPKAKFNNHKNIVDGHKFDSKIEAAYYQQLKNLKLDFKVHEKFEIQEAFDLPDGHHIRHCVYTPDFSIYSDGKLNSVVDTKGSWVTLTDASSLRMKFFEHQYKAPVIIATYDYQHHVFEEREK